MNTATDIHHECDFSALSIDGVEKAERWAAYRWELDRECDRVDGLIPDVPWLALDACRRDELTHPNLKNLKIRDRIPAPRLALLSSKQDIKIHLDKCIADPDAKLMVLDYSWIRTKSQFKKVLSIVKRSLEMRVGELGEDPPTPPPAKTSLRAQNTKLKAQLLSLGLSEADIKMRLPKEKTNPGNPVARLWRLACYRMREHYDFSQKDAVDFLRGTSIKKKSLLEYIDSAQAFTRDCNEAKRDIEQRRIEGAFLRSLSRPSIGDERAVLAAISQDGRAAPLQTRSIGRMKKRRKSR